MRITLAVVSILVLGSASFASIEQRSLENSANALIVVPAGSASFSAAAKFAQAMPECERSGRPGNGTICCYRPDGKNECHPW